MAGGDPRVSESGNRHVANSQIHWRLLVVWNFLVLIPCLVGGSIAQAPCIWWTYNPKHDTHELTFPCHQTDPGTLQRESLHRNQRHHRAPSKDMFSQQAFGMLNIAQSMKMHETSNTDLHSRKKTVANPWPKVKSHSYSKILEGSHWMSLVFPPARSWKCKRAMSG